MSDDADIALKESPAEDAVYDAFVAGNADALVYASSAYLRLLQSYLGCENLVLRAKSGDGGIVGVLPACISAARGGPPVMNSLPFYGSNGGFVGAWNPAVAKGLVDDFMETAGARGCATATIITSPFDPPEKLKWYEDNVAADLRDSRIGQVSVLPARLQDWPAHFENTCHLMARRAVKKARAAGVEVARTDRAGLDFVASVHRENMAAIGGQAKPQRFFDVVGEVMREGVDYRVFTATLRGEPVAALLTLYGNETVEYFTPVVKAEYRTTQALSLALYVASEDAVRSGYRRWNWGGTWQSQTGVYDFKRRWGAQDFPYHYFVRVFDRTILKASREELLERYPNFFVVPFSALEARP